MKKNQKHWILPGGKNEPGENDYYCIARELSEELPRTILIGGLSYFGEFIGESPTGKNIKAVCYFGNVKGNIAPSREIADSRWVALDEIRQYLLSKPTSLVIRKLLSSRRRS